MAEISVFPIEVFENTWRIRWFTWKVVIWKKGEKKRNRSNLRSSSPCKSSRFVAAQRASRREEAKTVPLINHLHLLLVFVAEWRPSSVSFRCKRIVKVQARRREESSIVFESTRMISHGRFPLAKTIENINHGSKSIGRLYRRVYEAGHSFRA